MKNWIEMHLTIPAALVDLVGSELSDLGCEGVTVEERPLDTFVPPDPDADLPDVFAIKAYFPQPDDETALLAEVHERLCELADFAPGWAPDAPRLVAVGQEDWAEGWKQHFSATHIGRRLIVKPSWEAYSPTGDEVVIDIDPGMAFGTGTHGTTRLCLEALAEVCETKGVRTVLDVGTGSGILSLAAVALGAERVVACDIDPEACRIAAENAELNHMLDRIVFTTDDLAEIPGRYDIVVANILAEENIRLAPLLIERLAPGATLILSGILQEKERLVQDGFASWPLTAVAVTRREEWSCLIYFAP